MVLSVTYRALHHSLRCCFYDACSDKKMMTEAIWTCTHKIPKLYNHVVCTFIYFWACLHIKKKEGIQDCKIIKIFYTIASRRETWECSYASNQLQTLNVNRHFECSDRLVLHVWSHEIFIFNAFSTRTRNWSAVKYSIIFRKSQGKIGRPSLIFVA